MSQPIKMIIHCPKCNRQHVEDEQGSQKPHTTHTCLYPDCLHVWRPANETTEGVQVLPTELAPKGIEKPVPVKQADKES